MRRCLFLAAAVVLHVAAASLAFNLLTSTDNPTELQSTRLEVSIVPPQALAMAESQPVVQPAPVAPRPPEKKPALPPPKPTRKPLPKPVEKPETQRVQPASQDSLLESEPAQPAVPAQSVSGQAAVPAQSVPAPTGSAAQPARTSVSVDATAAATNRKPVYPPMSQRYCEFGTVVLRVYVNADGRAGNVELKQSSGYSLLDESAKTAVQSWRFRPGTVDGKPVAEWYQQAIPFQKPPHC